MAIISQSFWVFKDNFMATLLGLAFIAEYDSDKDELDMIMHEILSTSDELDIWYDYAFIGKHSLRLYFAQDEENNDIIFIRCMFESSLKREIDLCTFFTQEFNLRYKRFPEQI